MSHELSARRIGIDDHAEATASCADHAIAEHQPRAVIETFRPPSQSPETFPTR